MEVVSQDGGIQFSWQVNVEEKTCLKKLNLSWLKIEKEDYKRKEMLCKE